MRVIIVGAGLGGLCLAHGLREAGVDTVVLERRPAPGDQPSSYGIHLNADGLVALHACLPAENWERLVETSVPAPDVVRFHDQRLRILAVRDNEPAVADPITRRRAVGRDALRDALLAGLDPIVQWGKEFSAYDETSGGVHVRCADGTTVAGDLLIGADGSNSRVRAQRLPGLERQDLGILNISGRVPLTPALARALPETLTDGAVNNVVPARPGWMFLSTWHTAASGKYLVWAWAADRDTYPADIDSATQTRLRDLVAACTAEWAPELHRLVVETDAATVAAIPLKTMPRLPAWQASTVTLVGDAIHNMTPMAGIGANTALRDAGELRRALLAPGDHDLTVRVSDYEEHMRVYANQALALSTRNAQSAATTARLPRTAFRTVLRVAEAVPAVKRRMFS
jgi:2-polyprenyl-6-methoxyphenol hydroxylase-like FAD-dependent oxidoreductase